MATPRDSVSFTRRLRGRSLLVLGVGVAALLVAIALPIAVRGADRAADSPAGTVRDFLINAVVDNSGRYGCPLLTPAARRQVVAAGPPDTSCVQGFRSASLTLGDVVVDREATVKSLHYAVAESGDSARVTVSAEGESRTFELHKATQTERTELNAPATSWRIASGVRGVLDGP